MLQASINIWSTIGSNWWKDRPLIKRTLEADYGMTLEDYTKLLQAHETTRALLRKELAERRLKAQEEQAQRAFEQDLENIHGDD